MVSVGANLLLLLLLLLSLFSTLPYQKPLTNIQQIIPISRKYLI